MSENTLSKISANHSVGAFVVSDNVELLWSIITRTSAFHECMSSDSGGKKLRQYYIASLKKFVETNISYGGTLLNMNKEFIAEFIRGFKSDAVEQSVHLPQTPSNDPAIRLDLSDSAPLKNNLLTIEELKSDRLTQFENRYDALKSDFEKYQPRAVPKEVAFGETGVESAIGGEAMDSIVTQTMLNRSEEESTFGKSDPASAEQARQWLNIGDSGVDISHTSPLSPPKKVVSFTADTAVDTDYPTANATATATATTTATATPDIRAEVYGAAAMAAVRDRLYTVETKMNRLVEMIDRLMNVETEKRKTAITSDPDPDPDVTETESTDH